MIYGLYLSATGVLANSHRQDVIANNLANSETVGFKRHLAVFQQRPTEAQHLNNPGLSDPTLEGIGGGFLLSPTMIDTTQGELETTGNNLDAAIVGKGYFAVEGNDGKRSVTRDGRFLLDHEGKLILANSHGQHVLGTDGKSIELPNIPSAELQLGNDGQITHNGKPVGRLGVFKLADESQLVKQGESLFGYPDLDKNLVNSDSEIRGGFVERANVDPANELVTLMETQRQLEANANMIRYQDQSLSKLVNEVGKIG